MPYVTINIAYNLGDDENTLKVERTESMTN